MHSGLAVAAESNNIKRGSLFEHALQLLFEKRSHIFARWKPCPARSLRIKACFAVQAVETAHLAVDRRKVDAQRRAQPAAVYRAEYCLVEKNCLKFSHVYFLF